MKTLNEILKRKKAIFTFGRFNPPTLGHEKLIEKLLNLSSKKDAIPFIFVSRTHDNKKNPLDPKQKIKFLKLGLNLPNNIIIDNPKIKTPFDAIEFLISKGFTDIIMIVGQDRVSEFQNKIGRFINSPDKSKSFDLNSFNVVSAGERDPDSSDIRGISASKMRLFAKKNDLKSFLNGIPKKMSKKLGKEIFDLVRKQLSINEDISKNIYDNDINKCVKTFKNYIKEQDDEKEVDKVKLKQKRERENLLRKQAIELEKARKKDFRNAEIKRDKKQREKEFK